MSQNNWDNTFRLPKLFWLILYISLFHVNAAFKGYKQMFPIYNFREILIKTGKSQIKRHIRGEYPGFLHTKLCKGRKAPMLAGASRPRSSAWRPQWYRPASSSRCRKCRRVVASGTSCSKKLSPMNLRMA